MNPRFVDCRACNGYGHAPDPAISLQTGKVRRLSQVQSPCYDLDSIKNQGS